MLEKLEIHKQYFYGEEYTEYIYTYYINDIEIGFVSLYSKAEEYLIGYKMPQGHYYDLGYCKTKEEGAKILEKYHNERLATKSALRTN